MQAFKKIFVLLLALLLTAAAGCSSAPAEGLSPSAFRERFNTLVTEMGYDAYLLGDADLTASHSTLEGTVMSGLFTVIGVVSDGVIDSLTMTFSPALQLYISSAEDETDAMVRTLFLACFVPLALTDEYETADEDTANEFLKDTLMPALSDGEVRRVGDFKMSAAFLNSDATDCRLTLTRLR